MPRDLSDSELALVELVHFLTSRSQMSAIKVRKFLQTEVDGKHLTVIECLDREGMAFVNRLKIFVNQSES